MISADDINAFREEDMGSAKDIIVNLQDQLSVAYAKAHSDNLQDRVQPAIDFMSKLPIESYLIGGSIRDTIANKDIRDYDIYVGPDFTNEMLEAIVGTDKVLMTSDGVEYPGQIAPGQCNFDRKISRVITVELDISDEWVERHNNFCKPTLQIMVLKEMFATPEDAARSVDFGICQAAYSLKTGLHVTGQFFSDIVNRTFTYMPENRSDNDRLRSQARFQRLRSDKYYGYTSKGLF